MQSMLDWKDHRQEVLHQIAFCIPSHVLLVDTDKHWLRRRWRVGICVGSINHQAD